MKKIIALLVIALTVLGAVACKNATSKTAAHVGTANNLKTAIREFQIAVNDLDTPETLEFADNYYRRADSRISKAALKEQSPETRESLIAKSGSETGSTPAPQSQTQQRRRIWDTRRKNYERMQQAQTQRSAAPDILNNGRSDGTSPTIINDAIQKSSVVTNEILPQNAPKANEILTQETPQINETLPKNTDTENRVDSLNRRRKTGRNDSGITALQAERFQASTRLYGDMSDLTGRLGNSSDMKIRVADIRTKLDSLADRIKEKELVLSGEELKSIDELTQIIKDNTAELKRGSGSISKLSDEISGNASDEYYRLSANMLRLNNRISDRYSKIENALNASEVILSHFDDNYATYGETLAEARSGQITDSGYRSNYGRSPRRNRRRYLSEAAVPGENENTANGISSYNQGTSQYSQNTTQYTQPQNPNNPDGLKPEPRTNRMATERTLPAPTNPDVYRPLPVGTDSAVAS